jgi:hypothetical protein
LRVQAAQLVTGPALQRGVDFRVQTQNECLSLRQKSPYESFSSMTSAGNLR